jgi:predicted aminopeptidase
MLTEARGLHLRRLAGALLLMSSWSLSGCSVGYLLQAAHGQWQLLRARQPIARLIAAPDTDAELKRRLELVHEVRDFATRELALPDNQSYRSYSALGRPYVVWNVVAAPEFSIAPLRWCFPISGCVAYRGYFREANARRFAARLAQRGNDTLVAGVSAYSTLGRFADPLLDTMLRYGDLELVGTIFHELAHQLVYVKDDSEFNEAFAMSVERAGVARWLVAHNRQAELAGYQQRQEQQAQIVRLLGAGRAQLAQLYGQAQLSAQSPGSQQSITGLRARKQALIASTTAAVRDYELQQKLRSGYGAWLDTGLNNAHLASVATYFDCVPGFERLLTEQGGDFRAYYAAVRALAHGPAAGRRAWCTRLPP